MPQKTQGRPDLETGLDERLLLLGRKWFEEVRRQHPDETPRRRWSDPSRDADVSDSMLMFGVCHRLDAVDSLLSSRIPMC